jgi:hypothetical protein
MALTRHGVLCAAAGAAAVPENIRARYRALGDTALFPALAPAQPAREANTLGRTVVASLKSVARRHQQLHR